MNISNYLTISRIILAFICMGLILINTVSSLLYGLIVFIIASFTDFLDGFIARRKNASSDLGKLLDPIADKILILGSFLAFLELGVINAWMVIVIILRELLITGLRVFNLNKGHVLEAKRFGKHKMLSQVFGICFIFITLIAGNKIPGAKISSALFSALPLMMIYIVIITAFSGIYYLWVNRKIIKTY